MDDDNIIIILYIISGLFITFISTLVIGSLIYLFKL